METSCRGWCFAVGRGVRRAATKNGRVDVGCPPNVGVFCFGGGTFVGRQVGEDVVLAACGALRGVGATRLLVAHHVWEHTMSQMRER